MKELRREIGCEVDLSGDGVVAILAYLNPDIPWA
jgi:hypothetical protein